MKRTIFLLPALLWACFTFGQGLSNISETLAAPDPELTIPTRETNNEPVFDRSGVYISPKLPITEPTNDTLAGWSYTWVFNDGSYYMDTDTLVKNLASARQFSYLVTARGRYQNPTEPPMKRVTKNGQNGTLTGPSIAFTSLTGSTQSNVIRPNWSAARKGDTILLVMAVRNNTDGTNSGYLMFRYPDAVFEWIGEIYPHPDSMSILSSTVPDDVGVTILDGNIKGWRLNNFQRGEERAVFAAIKVKDVDLVSYNTTHNLDIQLIWGDIMNTVSKDQTGSGTISKNAVVFGDDAGDESYNPSSFSRTNSTTISINYARDPNNMIVEPNLIYPTRSSTAQEFKYTVNVENLGNVPAVHLKVSADMEPRLNQSSFNYDSTINNKFPFATKTYVCPLPAINAVKWFFENANLAPALLSSREGIEKDLVNNKAAFSFFMKLQTGLNLVAGDSLSSNAMIKMLNNNISDAKKVDGVAASECDFNFVVEDRVVTNWASIHVARPVKIRYGVTFGLKYHSALSRVTDSKDSVGAKGVNLTIRFPLWRPKQFNTGSLYLKKVPYWFWQFEIGGGNHRFVTENGATQFQTSGLHLTPAQLRFIYPLRLAGRHVCAGFSAAYNTAYIFNAQRNGLDAVLPSGFFNRLEHEWSVSFDIQNRIDVPSVTAGFGYKSRSNDMFGSTIRTNYPFVYLQVDIVRLGCGFVKVMNKVYRW